MAPPSKKRKTNSSAPEQIDFDFAAREEFLTGFHKRKVQRKKLAEEENAKKEREEKLRVRAEVRWLSLIKIIRKFATITSFADSLALDLEFVEI
jgi:hypothetical protein